MALGPFDGVNNEVMLETLSTVERAELITGDRSLTISTAADGPATVYLDAVRLNGESLDRT